MKKVYAIRDCMTKTFLDPFLAMCDRDAKYMLKSAVMNPNSLINQSPGDYELFCIGEFDEEFGRISGVPNVVSVALAKEYVVRSVPVVREDVVVAEECEAACTV